ncbi:DUF6968 family protein [Symmachiella macrocystis]|uniref:DUF6968 family protein n=1 Tax=Symmachiella macrocystis TaxID=2527985 RepID=UPI0011B75921|nr:hypothetical protein [Symmachiella macrocystis]
MSEGEMHRQLFFRQRDGNVEEAEVVFKVFNNGSEWQCDVEVAGIPSIDPSNFHILGEDAIQALTLALRNTAFRFEQSRLNHGCPIWWLEQGGRRGTRVAKALSFGGDKQLGQGRCFRPCVACLGFRQ